MGAIGPCPKCGRKCETITGRTFHCPKCGNVRFPDPTDPPEVGAYDDPEGCGYLYYVTPPDDSWIVYIDTEGNPEFYKRDSTGAIIY